METGVFGRVLSRGARGSMGVSHAFDRVGESWSGEMMGGACLISLLRRVTMCGRGRRRVTDTSGSRRIFSSFARLELLRMDSLARERMLLS